MSYKKLTDARPATERRSHSPALPHDWGLRTELLSTIEHFRRCVERPEDTAARIIQQHLEAACLREIMENGMMARLCSAEYANCTVYKLAEIPGCTKDRTVAIMKILACAGILDPLNKSTFVANDVTRLLNHSEQRRAIRKPKFEDWRTTAKKNDGCSTPTTSESVESDWWFRIFPLKTELQRTDGGLKSDRALVVDVNGGSTTEVFALQSAFPETRGKCIMEVRLDKFTEISNHLEKRKKMRPTEGIHLVAYNALGVPQPVRGARFYLLHGNLHDGGRDDALKILRNTVHAMDGNYSRLLIVEPAGLILEAGNEIRIAQDPRGVGQAERFERAVKQWQSLLSQAGLKIVQVWGRKRCGGNVIEAMKKSSRWI